jgi:hypothetical protein
MTQLTVFGGFYILAFPLLVIISIFIAPYVQHTVITIGTLLCQTIAVLLLSYICTSKNSSYYKASLKAQTLLPSKFD